MLVGAILASPEAASNWPPYGTMPCQQLENISRILADFLGSISYSSAMFFAKGPVIIIEIVLLAVAMSCTY